MSELKVVVTDALSDARRALRSASVYRHAHYAREEELRRVALALEAIARAVDAHVCRAELVPASE